MSRPPDDAAPSQHGASANNQSDPANCTPNLAEALRLAALGWHVFPSHTAIITEDAPARCSCGDAECQHVGKHPRTQHGLKDATTDAPTIRQWWTWWPDANVAARTGPESGIVALDRDPRNGGDETLAELETKHGKLPHTVQALTGGGGGHYLFAHPGRYIKSRTIAPGLDVKGDGGYIIVEPSRHASGNCYTWELSCRPGDVALAPIPPWLLEMMVGEPQRSETEGTKAEGSIREGHRNSRLTSLAGSMRHRGMGEPAIRAALQEENAARCVPPLAPSEVDQIAHSVSRYEPGDVTAAPWSSPAPLHERACKFPLQQAFPPGTEPLRDYCTAIAESYQVPVDLPAMSLIAVAGLPLSHVVSVRLGPEWPQPPNQYMAVLMEPGNRKTAPFREIAAPVYEWEQQEAERLGPIIAEENTKIEIARRKAERYKDLASGKGTPKKNEPTGGDATRQAIEIEKELASKKPVQPPQLIAGDITTEELARVLEFNAERVGAFSDESEAIEVFLGRYDGKPNIQLYNKGYDGSFHRYNRVGRPPVLLKHPLLSLLFVIQPEGVRELLENKKAKGTGLIARFAMSLPESRLGGRLISPPAIPPHLRSMWRRSVFNLMGNRVDASKGPTEVGLTGDARRLFHAFCAHIEADLSWCGEFESFGMRDWGSKLAGRIGRIALVLHGLGHAAGACPSLTEPISAATMNAAIAWAPYLIDHAKAVMGWIGIDEIAAAARRILAWAARTGLDSFTKQECFTAVRSVHIRLAEDVDRPLTLLCDLQYLRPLPPPPKDGPGRNPSPGFLINPTWDRRAV